MGWFNRNIPKEKPLGLDTAESASETVDTDVSKVEASMESAEKPRSFSEVQDVSKQRLEAASQKVRDFKGSLVGKSKALWSKVAGFGARGKEFASAVGSVALAPDVAASVAYDKVASKAKEGYDAAAAGIEAGKNKLVSAGEAVANKATEKYDSLEQRVVGAKDKMKERIENALAAFEAKKNAMRESKLMQQYEQARSQRDDVENKMLEILGKLEDIRMQPSNAPEVLPQLATE